MKKNSLFTLLLMASFCLLSSCSKDDPCKESTFYKDADNDGFGDASNSQKACTQPTGYVANSTDADDTNAAIFPGCTEITYYMDADGDGFGDAANSQSACVQPIGFVTTNTDPDDNNAALFPGCTQVTYYLDFDEDGYGDPETSISSCIQINGYVLDNTDCNDEDAAIHPGATDDPNDGIDSDCDGEEEIISIIWTGADITFTKAANADWTLPENQDHITEKVVFTRQNKGPLYNYQWWQDTFGEDAVHSSGLTSDLAFDFWNGGGLGAVPVKEASEINPSGGTKDVRWAILDPGQGNYPNSSWENFALYGNLGDSTHFYSFNNIATMIQVLNNGETISDVIDNFTLNPSSSDVFIGDVIVGPELGVWLVEEDIYLTLTFTEWGQVSGGSISYTRSTPN
ncbi:putative metal-binding motif-containing protein [Muricauda sp. CAU 1633]|uniref:putative metal-binding motif-containing protein n=1 Tax=Allomuricauda sp. CAU 1633 TaxID=2816036 RepID=UPI001A8D6933|nr:putative metal-binding motif-containing protein [Muricauda sp. CAU 1633]MBO0323092.1 putative metal-binding motif-containing protein [Muricauda sp. CAU 1633]